MAFRFIAYSGKPTPPPRWFLKKAPIFSLRVSTCQIRLCVLECLQFIRGVVRWRLGCRGPALPPVPASPSSYLKALSPSWVPVMLWLDSGFPGPLAGVPGIVFRQDWRGKSRCSGYWWRSARWPWLGLLLCDCVLGAAAHSAEKTGKKLQCLFSSEKKHLEDFF